MYIRKGNLRFEVIQNNQDKTLVIKSFEKAIDTRRDGDYFAYSDEQVLNQDFTNFVSDDIKEIIEDNVEFDFLGNDLKSVLDKVINFELISSEKIKHIMNVHTERSVSTPEIFNFVVTLEKRIFLKERLHQIITKIQQQGDAFNAETGVFDGSHFTLVLDDVMDYMHEANLDGVLCCISVEGFVEIENNNPQRADKLIAQIADLFRVTLRNRDILGYLGGGKFVVIMVRTFEDETIYPLKRLSNNLAKEGLKLQNTSYNARYMAIDVKSSAEVMLDAVRKKEVDYSFNE